MKTIFDGKKEAQKLQERIKQEVSQLSHQPKLTIIQTSDSDKHNRFTSIKKNVAEELGIDCDILKQNENITENELIEVIKQASSKSDGILVQLPLPEHINKFIVFNEIPFGKDVEALSKCRAGALFEEIPEIYSPTAVAVIHAIECAIPADQLAGKNAVVVGKSFLIGKPVALALTHLGVTVTFCGSKTQNLENFTKNADIVVSCTGKKHLITKSMIKDGAILIDAGYEVINNKIYGDIDPAAADNALFFTPVPGGIGPLTIAFIFKNLINLIHEQK